MFFRPFSEVPGMQFLWRILKPFKLINLYIYIRINLEKPTKQLRPVWLKPLNLQKYD